MSEKSINSDTILSADIVLNSERAESAPEIRGFIDLVTPEMIDDCVPFGFLQSQEIIPYWPRMVIDRFEKNIQDYRHIFVGSHVVEAYGVEFTGTLLGAHPDESEGVNILRTIRNGVMETGTIAYYSGSVLNEDYHAKYWHAANMPFIYPDSETPSGTVSVLLYY